MHESWHFALRTSYERSVRVAAPAKALLFPRKSGKHHEWGKWLSDFAQYIFDFFFLYLLYISYKIVSVTACFYQPQSSRCQLELQHGSSPTHSPVLPVVPAGDVPLYWGWCISIGRTQCVCSIYYLPDSKMNRTCELTEVSFSAALNVIKMFPNTLYTTTLKSLYYNGESVLGDWRR